MHGGVDRLPPLGDRGLALPAEFSDAALALAVARGHRVTEGRLGHRDRRGRA
jgi:hypothetical protein